MPIIIYFAKRRASAFLTDFIYINISFKQGENCKCDGNVKTKNVKTKNAIMERIERNNDIFKGNHCEGKYFLQYLFIVKIFKSFTILNVFKSFVHYRL